MVNQLALKDQIANENSEGVFESRGEREKKAS
jgi:hypothetical protein